MNTLTVAQQWEVGGVLTNATSVTYGLARADNSAVIVAAGTALPQTATGKYSATITGIDGSTTYNATITLVAAGQTYTFTQNIIPQVLTTQVCWPHGFRVILDQLTALAAQITLSPNPSYTVEGHSYEKGEYLEIIGRQLEQFSKLYAQQHPFEIVTGYGGE